MRKYISVLLCAVMIFAVVPLSVLPASAEVITGECGAEGDNITWLLDTETGELIISGSGDMYDWFAPWYDYCAEIKSVSFSGNITSIGQNAFYGCTGLTSITIPSSVTDIGYSAFRGCTGLTNVTIQSGVETIGWEAFRECTGLTSITIPSSVTDIGYGAFYGCTGLTSITIPSSVTDIGDYAFDGCSSLADIYCEAKSEPSGWSFYWLGDCKAKVHWGEKGPECPVSSLGAKINTACSGLRLGCKYDASKISPERRFDITDMGVVFYPTRFMVAVGQTPLDLSLETEGAASVRAVAIEEYVPGNVFTDYETFTFYATIINIPASGKDKEISFRPYVIYNDGVVEYGDVMSRSYNYVVANTLAAELGDNEIPAPDDWWAPAK